MDQQEIAQRQDILNKIHHLQSQLPSVLKDLCIVVLQLIVFACLDVYRFIPIKCGICPREEYTNECAGHMLHVVDQFVKLAAMDVGYGGILNE